MPRSVRYKGSCRIRSTGIFFFAAKGCTDLTRSFLVHPEYLEDAASGVENIEFWDMGPELTRPARALKLWMTLQVLGTKYMAQSIVTTELKGQKVLRLCMINPRTTEADVKNTICLLDRFSREIC